MNLARLLRFFGLRPRHAPGYRARLSLRMSRVFHRRSTLLIPENQPVALDWGTSSSTSMDLRRSPPRARQVDVESRLLVQRLILEELQSHGRRRRRKQPMTTATTAMRDARMAMIEHAEALSAAFLEGRGSELLPPARTSSPGEEGGERAAAAAAGTGGGGGAHQLTRREERKLRKSVARAVRCDEKQQKKLEKLNKQRAKQYARAQAFFEQTTGAMQDVSLYRSSFDVQRGSATYRFDMNAGDARWRRLSEASESLSSSLTRFSKQDSDASSLARSRTKPPRMEFLFFGGNAEDGGWNDLEFGYQRFRPSASAAAFGVSETALAGSQRTSCGESTKIRSTLAREMPRPFAPRMSTSAKEIFI